jgi:hypothetical protein
LDFASPALVLVQLLQCEGLGSIGIAHILIPLAMASNQEIVVDLTKIRFSKPKKKRFVMQ